MTSRMDRYDNNRSDTSSSRLSKNKKLYEELYTNTSYTEFIDIDSSNVVDLMNHDDKIIGKREKYQRTRDISGAFVQEKGKLNKSDNYRSYQFMETELKNYDINSVLEDAKKNRNEIDELEKKRKLRTTEYNILADLTQEKLKEHQQRKKEVLTKDEEEELVDLINTITSNTMRQEINEQLLGDLMPNNLDETIVSEDFSKDFIDKIGDSDFSDNSEEIVVDNLGTNNTISEISQIDKSFYTKSMDLSDQDLIPTDDDIFFREKKDSKILVVKSLIVCTVLILVGIVIFILYNTVTGN